MVPKQIVSKIISITAAGLVLFSTGVAAADFPKKVSLPETVVRNTVAVPLPAADAISIHELLHRVYLAEDTRDAEALRQAVSTDFIQNHNIFGRLQGRDAFAKWVMDNPQAFDGFRHQALNVATRATGKHRAEAVSYIMVLQVYSSDDKAMLASPRIIGHGIVKDRLVKENGKWVLASRTYDQFSVLPALFPDDSLRTRAQSGAPLE